MIPDPIVEEIREIRKAHAAKYGNDLDRIAEALREFERTSGREYVNFEPRRVSIKQTSEATEKLSVPDTNIR
jgi:hypothetical protein